MAREHYVSNQQFLEVLNAHKKAINKAKKLKQPLPRTPEFLGEYFLKIAKHLGTRPEYAGYSYLDLMIDDGIETCIARYVKIHTEDGPKTIGEICDTKYTGKVLSLSKEGKLEWKKIIGHSCRKNTEGKIWVTIQTRMWSKSAVVCTDDHLCAAIKNPLNPVIEYIPARDLIGKWIIRKHNEDQFRKPNKLYNNEQLSFLIGTVLGDSSIDKQGNLVITHCDKQKEYLELKQKIFGGIIRTDIATNGYGVGNVYHRLNGPVNAQTYHLRRLLYKPKKNITEIIDMIDEKALAFWYMDDGCLCFYKNLNKHFAQISSQGFTKEENELLSKHLFDKFGIKASLNKAYHKTYIGKPPKYFLRINIKSSDILFKLIAKYVPECMRYKLPEKYRNEPLYNFNTKLSEYVAVEVQDVRPIHKNSRSKLYDITVEDNHNFFANDFLVHNCLKYYINYDQKKNPSGHPFAYFTQIIKYAFWRRIEIEKKQQYIKCKAFQASDIGFNLSQEEFSELPDELKDEISQDLKTYDNINEFVHSYEKKQAEKKKKINSKKTLTKKKK